VLRDCPLATQIWIRLVSSNQFFFLLTAGTEPSKISIINCMVFRIKNGAQFLWWLAGMWRNKTIFEDNFQRPTDHTYMILKMVEDIDKYTQHPHNVRQCDTIFVGWKRPQEGWVKLNCDGAYKDSSGLAGCGDLFRNSDDRWIKGYSQKIETCDAICVEMWGMYLGMQLAWRQGFHHHQGVT